MTVNQAGRCCAIAATIGFCLGLSAQLILLVSGIEPPPLLKTACTAVLPVVCLAVKAVHEWFFKRDYKKLVVERRQRMHW